MDQNRILVVKNFVDATQYVSYVAVSNPRRVKMKVNENGNAFLYNRRLKIRWGGLKHVLETSRTLPFVSQCMFLDLTTLRPLLMHRRRRWHRSQPCFLSLLGCSPLRTLDWPSCMHHSQLRASTSRSRFGDWITCGLPDQNMDVSMYPHASPVF